MSKFIPFDSIVSATPLFAVKLAHIQEIKEMYKSLVGHHEAQAADFQEQIAALKAENKRMREALGLLINFIPDGWEVSLGYALVVAQAREALRDGEV